MARAFQNVCGHEEFVNDLSNLQASSRKIELDSHLNGLMLWKRSPDLEK